MNILNLNSFGIRECRLTPAEHVRVDKAQQASCKVRRATIEMNTDHLPQTQQGKGNVHGFASKKRAGA